jgi:hypothetical protein
MGSRSAFDEKSPLAAVWRAKESKMKYREIIADNLSKAGWSWGGVSAIHSNGRTIWIADGHRDDGKRFVVRADEELTAFLDGIDGRACQARPYIEIRRFLTRQIYAVLLKTFHVKKDLDPA